MSLLGLRVIGLLWLYALVFVAVALTPPPVHAQEKNRGRKPVAQADEYLFENQSYRLTCQEKQKGGCLELQRLLEYAQMLKEKRRKEEERRAWDSGTLVEVDI